MHITCTRCKVWDLLSLVKGKKGSFLGFFWNGMMELYNGEWEVGGGRQSYLYGLEYCTENVTS